MKAFLLLFIIVVSVSCAEQNTRSEEIVIDLQGHRGSRGLMPENTVPAFLKALDYDRVTTLELDLAVTADSQLIVSHEPWFNPDICKAPDGKLIDEDEKRSIYSLTYEEIKAYDCGSLGNPRFPGQEKMKIHKPLLIEVIEKVNAKLASRNKESVRYNIEIKSEPQLDSIYTPAPEKFSDLVVHFVRENMVPEDVTIQSFDFRVLKYIHRKYPEMQLAALIENELNPKENLISLGFTPTFYSPYYKTLTENSIKFLHEKKIKVIPWTVNDTTDMKQLIDWQVDGIITDYPNLAQKILEK